MTKKLAKRVLIALVMLVSAFSFVACKTPTPPADEPVATGMIVKFGETTINSENKIAQIEYHNGSSWLENLHVFVVYDNGTTTEIEQKTETTNGYKIVHSFPATITESNIGDSYAVSVEYSTYSELFTIKITKKVENISINSLDKEFDGTPVEAVVTKLNPNPAEIKWFTEQGVELPSAPSNVGKYYVVVSTTESDTIMAGTKRLDFEITKQTPITPAALVIDSYTYSPTQTLDDIDLGSEYRWKNGSSIYPTCDVTSYTAIYNPDPQNYKDLEVTVTLTLKKATPTYTLPDFTSAPTYDSSTRLENVFWGAMMPEGFSWKNGGDQLTPGISEHEIFYTPQDTVNYKTVKDTVSVWYIKKILTPEIAGIYSYKGTAQTPEMRYVNEGWEFDETLGDLKTQTNAGTYNLVVKISDADKYSWDDESSTNKTVTWTINQYTPGLRFEFSDGSYAINAYYGTAKEVVIPATYQAAGDDQAYPVTKILADAFNKGSSYRNTQEIYFLGSVSIEGSAFKNNSLIRKVVVNDLATWYEMKFFNSYANPMSYGADLYFGTNKVTELALTKVNAYMFDGCTSLTSVDLSSVSSSYGLYAFRNCANLQSVSLADALFKPETFMGTSIKTLSVKNGAEVLLIKNNCVVEQSSGNVIFVISGYNLNFAEATKLDVRAFYGVAGISSLVIPENITQVKVDSYSADIWNNFTSVKFASLQQCFGVEYSASSYNYNESFIDLYIAGVKTTNIEIPNTVTQLSNFAFYSYKLKNVTIHSGVVEIGTHCFGNIENLYIEDLASWCGVTFGSRVTPISVAANVYFGGERITSLVIPESVTEIKSYAFSKFEQITEVVIPSGLTKIGTDAFYDCDTLTAVRVADIKHWLNIQFGEQDKYSANPEANPLYYADNLYVNGVLLTELKLNEISGITEINSAAFYGYKKLTNVIIDAEITRIGARAFMQCKNLKSITVVNNTGWAYYFSGTTLTYNLSVDPARNAEIFTTYQTDVARSLAVEWIRR